MTDVVAFRPRLAAYGLALLFALVLACDLLWMPVQVGDSLGEILDAQHSGSIWESFTAAFGTTAYLRPLRIAQIKALFDLAQGQHYWLVYRGFHAVLAIAALMLFVRVMRVSTAIDFGAAAFALVVLIGLYTFRGTVREAFPINHFLEMVVACLLTLNLARSRGGIVVDAAATLTFALAALTLESGLLVWVVAVAAWLAGWRGISARGLALMTVLLLGYFYVRFGYLGTGTPALTERSAGYFFERLEPPELQQRFAAQPFWFYGYNIAASIGSVLFSEPQSGVFEAGYAWLHGAPLTRVLLPVIISIATTAVVIWAAARRTARLAHLNEPGGFILVFAIVLVANAMLSYAYAHDEIMSVAGAFYALAVFAAVREAMLTATSMRLAAAVGCTILISILAAGWAVRADGVHYVLRMQAGKHQMDWVELPGRWKRANSWPADPNDERLIWQLHDAAVDVALPNVRVRRPEWPDRLWVE
jgi:hypothetical protein